jgi:hypothetical protein
VTSVIANFHHRRITPLVERELHIFEMSNTANPMSLVRPLLLRERLPKVYTATRSRRATNLKVVPHSDDDLWSFVMLLDAGPVSTAFLCPLSFPSHFFARPDEIPACRW